MSIEPSQPSPWRRAARTWWPEAAILLAAFLFRVLRLGMKPPHFDEGVNGWFVDQMTANGAYHYDPTNFHGPLHFYLLFLAQTLLGRHIWALRLPLVLVSTAAVGMTLAYRRYFPPLTCRMAALAMALSPAMTFYARYAIHESELLFFLLLGGWGLLGLLEGGGRRELGAVVFAATGCILTKETYLIHFTAFALALPSLLLLEWITRTRDVPLPRQRWTENDACFYGLLGFGAIVFFYSGGFLDWPSLRGLVTTFHTWIATGEAKDGGHNKDWYYWLQLLWSYEWAGGAGVLGLVWVFFFERDRRPRYLAIAGCGAFVAYSIVRYKTPWCLISILWPFLFVFGEGVQALAKRVHPLAAAVLAAALLGHDAYIGARLNFIRYTDETEPYVYVQTLPAIDEILDPLRALVARDPAKQYLQGYVLFPPGDGHPLPWLLADFTRIDFLGENDAKPNMDADFLLIHDPYVSDVEERLQEKYFRHPLILRGNSGETSILYLRASTFGWLFPGREPEFEPLAPPPESTLKEAIPEVPPPPTPPELKP